MKKKRADLHWNALADRQHLGNWQLLGGAWQENAALFENVCHFEIKRINKRPWIESRQRHAGQEHGQKGA